MNRGEHRRLRESLGAFALDQLGRDERLAVQAHLDGCQECRDELAELRPLAGPLRLVDPAALGPPVEPPAGLGESIVERIGAEQRRRTRTAFLAAVVALALGVGVGHRLARGRHHGRRRRSPTG